MVTPLDVPLSRALDLPSGARFYKCALQVNPFEYLGRHGRATSYADEDAYNEAIVDACKTNHIEAIAVTDHYRIRSSLGLMDLCRSEDVVVFPGFEAYTKDGIHLLCVFDTDFDIDTIERLLGDCGIHSPDEPSPTGKYDVPEFLRESTGWGALCIAAHVTQRNGLLHDLSGLPRVHAWMSPSLLACSIPTHVDAVPEEYRSILKNKKNEYVRDFPMAIVNAKDVTDPRILADDGASCRIKMSGVSLEGLRQAFLDPESRILLNRDNRPLDHPILVAVTWDGGFLDGRAIHFNPELNVLVGGRGAGKSTVIESLRYVFDLEPRGDDAARTHRGIVREVLRAGTTISLRVRTGAPSVREYTIQRTVPNPPVVLDQDGGITPLSPTDVFPAVEVFGQREIAALTSNQTQLTTLLHRHIDSAPAKGDRQGNLKRGLSDTREGILRNRRDRTQIEDRLSALPGLEENLRRLRDVGLEDRLKDRNLLGREERLFESVLNRITPLRDNLSNLKLDLPIDPTFLSPKALDGLPGGEFLGDVVPVLSTLSEAMQSGVHTMEDALQAAEARIAEIRSSWTEHKMEVERQFERTLRSLGESAVHGNELIQTRDEIERLQPLRQEHQLAVRAEEEHIGRRRKLLVEWEDFEAANFRATQKAAKAVSRKLRGRVAVEVSRSSGCEEVIALLTERIGGRLDSVRERLRECDPFSLRAFVVHCREGAEALRRNYRITETQAQHVAGAPEEVLLLMDELELPAMTRLSLNTAPPKVAEVWRELRSLSTGQKATAVLLFLLLDSKGPLVVDQPEDDLDNRFISEDIVRQIREGKRTRQFLLSTHNANIPVLADAEMIVGLTAGGEDGEEGAQIMGTHMGAIDDRTVRELVEELLEGGRDAFERRRRKYGF